MNLTSSKNWKIVNMSDLAIFSNGKSSPDRLDAGKYPVYGANGIIGYSDEKNSTKDSIIIGRVGSYCGSLYFSDTEAWVTDNAIVCKAKENSDPKFIFYLLNTLSLNSRAAGSGQPLINQSILGSIEVSAPESREEQKKVSVILASLDDKIELLRKENKTLENIAQTLFKEWFVDFKFPGHEKTKIVSGIPEGWKVGKLADICLKIASGGTPQTKESSYWNGEVNWFSTKELRDQFLINSEKTISDSGLENSSAKLFPVNTVIVAIYAAPTVGRLGILTKESSFNQAACGLISNEEIVSFEYVYLLLLLSREILNQMANGAAQQNLSVGTIRDFKTLIPATNISDGFRDAVRPVFGKIKTNTLEIQTLLRLRDDLLNKIFSN